MKHSRRQFLLRSSLGTLAGLYRPLGSSAITALLLDESPNPLRFPTQYQKGSVTVSESDIPVWPDTTSRRITLDNTPLLCFEFEHGSDVDIPFSNNYASPISIHWHGLDVPAEMDGHPKDAFSSGTTRNYAFKVRNRAGLYFCHSHSHMATASEVYRGLVGMVIVRDAEERALGLPTGEYELPLLIQDVRVDTSGRIVYSPTMNDMMNGWMGNRVLVNGLPNTYHNVKKATYRLRILNSSNARMYLLEFSNKQSFTIIGTDGGILEQPIEVTSVQLAPAERIDILVDFSSAADDSIVKLVSAPYTAPVEMMSPVYPQGLALDIMGFRVSSLTGPTYSAPSRLCTFPSIPDTSSMPVRTVSLAMTRGMGMGMRPTLNGKTYDINRVDFEVAAGSYEIWEFRNQEAGMFHPMHIHGRQFRVLSRSGSPLLPTDKGLKDTVYVGPSQVVRVVVQHSDYEGLFLYHCHNLEHEDEGMMQNYVLQKPTSINEDGDIQFGVFPNPADISFSIRSNRPVIDNLRIFDMHGSLVREMRHVQPGIAITVEDLPAGRYVISCNNVSTELLIRR